MDLQRSLGVLIGRTIHSGMTVLDIVEEEEMCEHWLNTQLLMNGFEEREKLKGT